MPNAIAGPSETFEKIKNSWCKSEYDIGILQTFILVHDYKHMPKNK